MHEPCQAKQQHSRHSFVQIALKFNGLASNRRELAGRHQRRGNFGQRYQHKGALNHARARHSQPRRIDAGAAVKQKIQIERARRVAERPFTACKLLKLLKAIEQFGSWQSGFDFNDGIQLIFAEGQRLYGCVRLVIQRCSFINAGSPFNASQRQSINGLDGLLQCAGRITQIGAQCHIGRDHRLPLA